MRKVRGMFGTGDAVMRMHPQVRVRYLADIYARRNGLSASEHNEYVQRQEDRVIARLNKQLRRGRINKRKRKGPTK